MEVSTNFWGQSKMIFCNFCRVKQIAILVFFLQKDQCICFFNVMIQNIFKEVYPPKLYFSGLN